MPLNENQLKAVNESGSNILVFASAGGGKTTVLVERLLKRILKDHLSLNEIIAMTFTDAAAANMAKRLEKRLELELLKEPNNEFISQQIALLSNAHISTIHSFCLSILKEYYYVIGLKKSATENILDDGHRAIYLDDAVEKVLRQCDDLRELNALFSTSAFNYDSLKMAILAIIEKADATADPIAWLSSFRHNEYQNIHDIPTNIINYYIAGLKSYLLRAMSHIEVLMELDSLKSPSFKALYLEYEEALKEEDSETFLMNLPSLLRALPTFSKKNYKEEDAQIAKEANDSLAKVLEKLAKEYEPTPVLLKTEKIALKYTNRLIDIAIATYHNFEEIKRENNVIDFNDFEHFAYQILVANDYALAKYLANKYKEIMVDEFQDTSSSQWSIISLLANNNLFLVGDIKQSIYRFRNAKSSIMQSLKENDDYIKIHIRQNYRSKANITAFNNELFNSLMNLNTNDFDEEDYQLSELDSQFIDNIPVTYVKGYLKENDELTDKQLRARILAEEIVKDHNNGTAYKDMAIILRSHKEKPEIRDMLERYQIPYFIKENEGYFNCQAMDVLLSFFKLVLDPSDHMALIGVLSSPVYHLSDDELFENNHLFNISPFNEDFAALRQLGYENHLHELTLKILALHHFYDNLPQDEKTNIDYFLLRFNSYHFSSLASMIRFIEASKEGQKESAVGIAEDAPVVKVMTIHGSKGLEYDTVYFMSTHENRARDNKIALNVDDELGFGFNVPLDKYHHVTSTLTRRAIQLKANLENLFEYTRYLYVALTRAKHRLTIIDAYKKEKKFANPNDLLLAREGFSSYFEVLMKNSKHIEFKEVNFTSPLPSKNYRETKEIALPSCDYKAITNASLSPSSFESHNLVLDLDAIYGMEYGTKIHNVFERIDYHKSIDRGYIKTLDDSLSDSAIDAILYFTKHDLIAYLKPDKIYQEYSYYYKDNDDIYHGFMDFVYLGDEEILLCDYKTDIDVDEEELHKRYDAQQLSYVEALRKMYPNKEIKAYIYSLDLKQFFEVK